MTVIVWWMIAFFLGSLPFAFWLGRIALRVIIRGYGDSNPAAGNAWRPFETP